MRKFLSVFAAMTVLSAAAAPALAASHTVVKGDTLWEIACRFYGDGTRWRELAARNGVTDPKKLPIGKVLTL